MDIIDRLLAIDFDKLAMLINPEEVDRFHDFVLEPIHALIDGLLRIISSFSGQKPVSCPLPRDIDENDLVALDAIEIQRAVEEYRFRKLARRAVEQEIFNAAEIVDKIFHPKINDDRFGHEAAGIKCFFGQCLGIRSAGNKFAKHIAGFDMENFSAVLFYQLILKKFNLGSLSAAGSSDENKCLWFLLHAISITKNSAERNFLSIAKGLKGILVLPHRDLGFDLLDEINDDRYDDEERGAADGD